MKNLKRDIADLRDVTKSIHEVVLSSTHSSGFSLNGRIEPKTASEGAGIEQSTIVI
jgi:large subunit ribosomal protein L1